METTVMTEIVGSLVKIQGMRPIRARAKKYLSLLGGFLNPYFMENINIMTVNISETAVGIAPIPAPFATCPKKTTQETSVQINQVYGCGFIFPFITSSK